MKRKNLVNYAQKMALNAGSNRNNTSWWAIESGLEHTHAVEIKNVWPNAEFDNSLFIKIYKTFILTQAQSYSFYQL